MRPIHSLSRAWRRHRSEWLAFLVFAGPNAALFLVFTYWPIAYSAYLSLTDSTLLASGANWNLGANYLRVFQSATFWRVGANTLVYAVVVVAAAQSLAFLLALLLNRRVPGQVLFRTLAFLPHVTMAAAAALVWVVLLHPDFGPLSLVYSLFNVRGPNFLESSALALWALVIVGVWKEIGFASVFILAGLQGLPKEPYEAASLDGAKAFARLRHITLPLMSPIIFFLMVSGFIAAVKAFDIVAVMTEGGPVYPVSSTYVYHLYKTAFREGQIGEASAIAMIFFAATVGITAAQFRAARRWVHYED